MTDTLASPQQLDRDALATEAIALVRRWLQTASTIPADASAQQLAGVLKDPTGLEFTVGFVDGVVRPEDLRVAARTLQTIAPKVPAFLPWYLKAAVRCGGAFAPILPGVVIPISRKVLRNMVGHLVVDATDKKLGPAIAKIKTPGTRLNVNLLGEAVLGTGEAARRLEGTHKLLARPDVDYVSIKVSSTVSPHSVWAFDEAVEHVVTSLTPLFERAAKASPKKFINLDMEEYKDLDLTIAVFTKLLDLPQFHDLEAGIVLQAYLPDALSAMIRLQEWSAGRRAAGGAGIKVRIVKGANLPMEQVESSLHDWPLATWSTKQDSDTNYKRVVEYALHPDRIDNVRIGVAGHNLFDIAFAWLLAKQRGVERGVEFEMLLGMAQGQAEAVKRDVGELLLYTPVVHPQEFDVAIAYLIRRLEEGASQDNFMSAVFELSENETLFAREEQRFLASLAELDTTVPAPNRQQDRTKPAEASPVDAFENTPDTDPSLPANRVWGRDILTRVTESRLGNDTVAASILDSVEALDAVIDGATAAGASWGSLSGAERAVILHRAGDVLEQRRADLMEVMASETGKTLDQSDPEVSEAIDFAHYYAERARELDHVDGATFTPAKLTVVTPPWNFPVAIPAGSTLAALAAGSPVIIKPARQARRSGAVMIEALWEAGVPREVLRFAQLADNSLGERLIAHPAVERVILTGGYETAELFRSFRPELPLLAETSGKNAIIVTPSADLDLAVKDVVASAFGHAGQKCSAASLVILVGSVASSRRFRHQLVDARNGSISIWAISGSIRGPPLRTPISTVASVWRVRTAIHPFDTLCRIALSSRLPIIRSSSAGSPRTTAGSRSTLIPTCASWARARRSVTQSPASEPRSTGSARRSADSLRASSSRLSISRSLRSTVSRTASPIARSSLALASESASATSISVRMIASGVRSSWDALATKCRWLANAESSRASMPSNVSASSLSSSAGPTSPMRSPRFSPETRRAVAVIFRSGLSARPASSQPAPTDTIVITPSAATYSITSRCSSSERSWERSVSITRWSGGPVPPKNRRPNSGVGTGGLIPSFWSAARMFGRASRLWRTSA